MITGGAFREARAFGYYERFVRAFSSVIERRFGPPPGLHAAVAGAVRGTAGFARLRRERPEPRVRHRLVQLLRQSWTGECAFYGLVVETPHMTPTVLLLATRHLYSVVWAHLQAGFLALDGMERRHHTPLLHSMEAVLSDRDLVPPPWTLQDDVHVPRRHMRRRWTEGASTWGLDVTDDEIAALHDGVRVARLLDHFYRGPSARHRTTLGEALWLPRAHVEYRGIEWFLTGVPDDADTDALWSLSLIGVSATLTMLETLVARRVGDAEYAEVTRTVEPGLTRLCQTQWHSLDPLEAFQARRSAIFPGDRSAPG